jgi:hypothetical protein
MAPMFSLIPSASAPIGGRAWVPIDNHNTYTWDFTYEPHGDISADYLNYFGKGLLFPPKGELRRDDNELLRLIKGSEGRAEQVLLDLARGTSTEGLAHYVERGRKGVERNRLALQGIQRRLAMRGDEIPSGDAPERRDRLWLNKKTREELVALQQKARCELSQFQDALRIATAVLSERRH